MKLKNILNEAPKVKVDDGDPFPNMTKWWTYPKEKIMSFVYWTQRQMPPRDEKDYAENWQKVKAHLTLQHPPPPNVQLDEAPMDKRFVKDWGASAKAFINHIKHELKSAKGADKTVLKKMLQNLQTVSGYPTLMGRLTGMKENKSTKLKDLLGEK